MKEPEAPPSTTPGSGSKDSFMRLMVPCQLWLYQYLPIFCGRYPLNPFGNPARAFPFSQAITLPSPKPKIVPS